MKLRLSNGCSFAVDFNASNATEFKKNMRIACLEYFAKLGKSAVAELHVATDSGEWLSANYPRSNNPYYVKFGQIDTADWASAKNSNQRGTWFEYELSLLSDFIK